MREFGDKNKLYIAYEFLQSNVDVQWPQQTFGKMDFHVNGFDLCRYFCSYDGRVHSFEGILFWPFNWLFENLPYILGFEVFPLPVNGSTSIELYEKAFSAEFSNDVDLMLWRDTLFFWYCRHGWFNDRGGNVLPNIIFRCINDDIEISWDNKDYLEYVKFESMAGVSYISRTYVKDIFIQLLKAFRNDVIRIFPSNADMSKLIVPWDKTLGLFEFDLNNYM